MKRSLIKKYVIISMFITAILLPVLDMWLKLDRFRPLNENRLFAEFPHFEMTPAVLQKFPQRFTQYFNDNFGFRKSLIRFNSFIKYNLLGVSPSREVILGKEGWLFYNGEGEIEDYRGITRFDAKTLGKWTKTLEMKRDWLEKQGVRYLFVVIPNKSTIYGEYLPEAYTRVRSSTGLDDLVDYLKTHTSVPLVDCRPALLAAKSQGLLYRKTDTHWNQYGGFLAYRQVMKEISGWFPSLSGSELSDFSVERRISSSGGLAELIGVDSIREEIQVVISQAGSKQEIPGIAYPQKSPVTATRSGAPPLRALVFRDSFFNEMSPFFAEHFQVSKYYWGRWNSTTPIEEMISETKPDIVIEAVLERLVKTGMADFETTKPPFLR